MRRWNLDGLRRNAKASRNETQKGKCPAWLKPQRVTDFRVDIVEIREDHYYDLPEQARKLIETYAHPLKSLKPGYFRFELPIYRWEEIQPLLSPQLPTP